MATNQRNSFEEELNEMNVVEKYGKRIGIAIAAGMVIVLAVMGYKNLIVEPREAAANDAIVSAQKALSQQDSASVATLQKEAQKVADEYGSTDAGNLAHLYAGIALYNQGKYEAALDEFKSFDDCGDQNVSANVYGAIADCQACLKQFDDAVKNFKKAADKAGSENIKVMHLIKAGEICEYGLKDNAKALEIYNEASKMKAAYQVQSGQIDAYIQRASNK